MAVINHAKREINAKIVYFGSEGAGKGTLFRYIHQRIKPSLCGPLKVMPAGGDLMNFFEFTPFEHSCINGYSVKFHFYTMSGMVTNPGTWKMTLKGVDGLAVVVDSSSSAEVASRTLQSLRGILTGYGRDLKEIPSVLLASRSDLDGQQLDMSGLVAGQTQLFSVSTVTGDGVLQSLASLSQSVMQALRAEFEQHDHAAVPDLSWNDADEEHHAPLTLQPDKCEQEVRADEQVMKIKVAADGSAVVPLELEIGGQVKRFRLVLTLSLEE
jgi:uncharacterized protein